MWPTSSRHHNALSGFPPGVAHRVSCRQGTVVRSLYVDRALCREVDHRCKVLVVDDLLRELIRAFSLQLPEYASDTAEARLALVMLDRIFSAQEVDLVLPLPAHGELRRICRTMQLRPECRVDLAAWGAQLGVSGKTVSRMFIKETGMTFRAWSMRSRLLGTLVGLERGDRVTDVALDAGYESTSAFIAAFSGLFGQKPGEFAASSARASSPPL